jgi:predicted nuclease of predicted toxin-antitoxin system
MKFLIDEDLPLSCAAVCREFGFEADDVRTIGFRGAKDAQIAAFAKQEGYTLVTGDFDFSDIRTYPPKLYNGIVILYPNKNATATDFTRLLSAYLSNKNIVEATTGKLAIVESDRIRLRQ